MARNVYFTDKVRSEQNLYEDIVIESLKIYGQDVYYIPRDILNEDRIFGDDVPSRFNSSHKIEMYIENVQGFEGEGDLFTRFGVEIRDEATFVVSRRRWLNTVNKYDNEITSVRPLEGDLIYLPMTNKLFQIQHVEHEQPFYQLSNLPVFKLRATLFEYNDEDLDTGIASIDNIEADYAYTYILTLNRDGIIEAGETVTQILDSASNLTITGEITKWSDSDNKLHVVHVGASDGKYHNFITTRHVTISGTYRSDSAYTPTLISEENQISSNEQNTDFRTGSLDFLDFSESNPFGDAENQ
tara:strand:+ start:1320 stop:2216 length:897 start_codon:yes stop_codon:yes gene_type:complete